MLPWQGEYPLIFFEIVNIALVSNNAFRHAVSFFPDNSQKSKCCRNSN